MDQQSKIILQKVRGYRGILSAGTRLYISSFRKIFKASWLTALVYALLSAALGTLAAIKVPELIIVVQLQMQHFQGVFVESLQPYLVMLAIGIVMMLLTIVAMALAHATIVALLKEHSETGDISMPASWWKPCPKMMGRTLKGVLLSMLVTLPLLIVAPFALPMWFVLTKYVMTAPNGYWSAFRKSYGQGMSHWGSLFLVFFLTNLFVYLSGLVVMLPAHILFLANYQAQMGELIGDPLGMPSYMMSLTFATFILCSFLQFYISLPMLLNGYIAYGSIETEAQEHEQQKQDIQ